MKIRTLTGTNEFGMKHETGIRKGKLHTKITMHEFNTS
jgi:hypothetical protein